MRVLPSPQQQLGTHTWDLFWDSLPIHLPQDGFPQLGLICKPRKSQQITVNQLHLKHKPQLPCSGVFSLKQHQFFRKSFLFLHSEHSGAAPQLCQEGHAHAWPSSPQQICNYMARLIEQFYTSKQFTTYYMT